MLMILNRSCLTVPGYNLKMIEKAAATSADCIVFDLEDAVPVSQKARARQQVTEALRRIEFGSKYKAVRVNGIATNFIFEDIMQIAEASPDAIVVPKVGSAADIRIVEGILDGAEKNLHSDKKTALQAIIETAKGVQAVDEISRASRRLTALIFGMGDYFADIGAKFGSMEDYWSTCLYPRSRIVVAAVAAGIDPVDTMFPNFKDIDGLRADARKAAAMGFKGKWVIHPSQIETVNEIFSPALDEIRFARTLLAAYEKSTSEGVGAISVNDMLIDEAAIVSAIKLRDTAKQLGLWAQV
jgi:citrate lyase beta subunit